MNSGDYTTKKALDVPTLGNKGRQRDAKEMGHSLTMFMTTYAEWVDQFSEEVPPELFEGTVPKGLPPARGSQ